MYIYEVIIDGFKSYAQRTVVSGFDPQFNAITGLNGTGKSNILDSICFVLGISNLSQVSICCSMNLFVILLFCKIESMFCVIMVRFVLEIYKNLYISKVKQV